MEFVKTDFTIQDLENLSGVKKHTIRIWEKRYGLLSPERTETNIRNYSLDSLTQLLNIVLLYNHGYKISKIAELSENQILERCKNLISEKAEKNHFINELKIAMLNYDQQRFEKAYRKIKQVLPFKEIFKNYFVPFLNEIGLLWQTNTVNPAQEHFISNLIRQKILIQTEEIILNPPSNKKHKFVLFLPDNEIHDLAITYLNFAILSHGYATVYLGQSVPMDCLSSFVSDELDSLIFISYFTVKPETIKVHDYLKKFSIDILSESKAKLWVLGYRTKELSEEDLPKHIVLFKSIDSVLEKIEHLA